MVGESLCALTSLQLFCRHDMTLEGRGPPLAVVDMFRRMPVLARLELHRAHMLLPHDTPAALLEPLLQVRVLSEASVRRHGARCPLW